MPEFKYRKLIEAELDSGLRCQHLLPSRVTCNRVAKMMYWSPYDPNETPQPYCEAHCIVEKLKFQETPDGRSHIVDLDSVGTMDSEAVDGADTNEAETVAPTTQTTQPDATTQMKKFQSLAEQVNGQSTNTDPSGSNPTE